MRDGLEVGLLGPLVVDPGGQGDGEQHLRGHAATLLAWLALHPERAWSADDLARRLWPDGPPATFRTAIQGHVSRLRKALDGAAVRIETVPRGYRLRTRAGNGDRVDGGTCSPVDTHRFRALCERAGVERAGDARRAIDLLTRALALWRGDALAGLRRDPALRTEAEALDDERRDAEDALADALVGAGETDRALALLGRLLNDDPLRERRWALLMIALTRAGRQTAALRAYRRAAAVLADRTGLEPGPELRRVETAILLQDPSLDAARWQPAPGCAPTPLAGVVGRDAARASVVARLATSRVVTLVGPGGVGKTTLAVDIGAAAGDTFADGAVVVELGPAGPADVGAATAAAVVAPPPGTGGADGDDPLGRAVAVLAGREVLVVLDGCEHVRAEAACAAVELLRAGPGIKVLATSQVPLGVAGEAVVALDPLEVPPERSDADTARRSPAAELLARRLDDLACPLRDDESWRHAAAIVRALDGLPLAIEIAATAARTEPLAALARRLSADASSLLDAEPPAGAGRRRLGTTLDAAVARLDAEAARVYAHLSVFPAGCAAPAAAAVAGIAERAAASAITRLADASLVALDPDRRRARLLQPVRAHAATLLDAGDTVAAHRRLVAWCLAEATDLDRELHSPAEAAAVARFMAELPTFRTVLRRLVDGGDAEGAARLFERLSVTWVRSPATQEAQAWGDELLDHAGRLPDGVRARLGVAVVHCQYAFEMMTARLDLAEESLERAQATGDRVTAAMAQTQVAIGLGWRGTDLDRAARLLDDARATLVDHREPYWAAVVQEVRGLLALRRLDVAAGIALLDEAAAEHRVHGGPGDVGHALTFIGYGRRAVGDLSGAQRAFDEARHALGEVQVRTWLRATVGAAHAALALGDLGAATEAFRAAHDRAVEIGDHRIVGTALVGLAAIARAESDTDRCVALLAAATERALAGGDPTDAVTAAAVLGEMLVTGGAADEAAVLVGASDLVEDELGVRVDFGLARDLGPVREAVERRLGPARAADLAADGRVIGLAASVRRAAERLLGESRGGGAGAETRVPAPPG